MLKYLGRPMRRRRLFAAALVAATLAVAGSPPAVPPAGASSPPPSDFESPGFATGSVDGQGGWGAQGIPVNPNLDQEVVTNSGAPPSFGAQSLRFSSAFTTGSFGDQVFSPSAPDEAGEASAENGGLSGGTRETQFVAQWDFASASPGAEQPGLGITVSPDRGDGARMSYVRMEDHPDGLGLLFYDYQQALDPGCATNGVDGFAPTQVATGLDRGTAHTVKVVMDFPDGPANDVVEVYLDDQLVHTGTSWEDYFRDCEGNATRTVDSLLFRSSGANAPASDGLGFLIDNVSITTQTLSVPDAPTALSATPDGSVVDLSWSAPVDDGGSPLLGYTVYRDGNAIDTTGPGTTTYQDTGAAASSAAHSYKVTAENALGSSADSNTDTAIVDLAWKGQIWDVLNGTAVVNGQDGVDLTRLGPGEAWIRLTSPPDINAGGTPWIEFAYQDDGTSWQGIDAFIDSNRVPDDPRISAGSLFSCPTLGYARHSIPAEETIVYPSDDGECVGPRPAEAHTLYVGQRSDGTVDYLVDGTWHSTTFLRDATGPFDFNDVILRWRCGGTMPAPWVVPCTGGETVTFDDFAMGDDHDEVGPEITITTPADGGTYRLDQAVTTDYGCTDDSGVATCDGPVDAGQPLDTSSTGSHDFTVTATDDLGNESTLTHSYTVVDPALTLELAADESEVVAGEDIHYSVTVTNVGDVPLTGIELLDPNAPDCEGPVGDLGLGEDTTVDCAFTTGNGDVPVRANAVAALSEEFAFALSNIVTTSVAPAPGHVQGTVTETGSGDPLEGVWALALRSSDFRLVGAAMTDAGGTYDLGLEAGSYFLYVVDPGGAHASGFFGSPDELVVPAGGSVPADPALDPTRGMVAGTVTEEGTGDPVADAWAVAVGGEPFGPEQIVTTDGSGTYALGPLAPGDHYVAWVDPSGAHEPRFAPDSANLIEATPVGVTAGTVSASDGVLPTQSVNPGGAALTGTVTETGTGDPLAGVQVIALSAADFRLARGTVTDANGDYALDVAPGDYKLEFVDGSGAHAMEWYDDLDLTGIADAVSASAPGVADADLDPLTGSIAGTVTDEPSGDPLEDAWVLAIGPSGPVAGAFTAADGTYTLAGLPAGEYRLVLLDATGARLAEYWDDQADFAGSDPIAVTAGGVATADAALAP